ncbi:MAG: hypothetical protein NTW32_16320 [Chloroflexi bacterium]|nr:hypothetical protein [Chloroflexota bacterium]
MSGNSELNFQWQNPFLMQTIYPLREMKLRDFLIFFREIDLWAEYKNKSDAQIESEKPAFIEAQKKVMADMLALNTGLRNYFMSQQPQAEIAKRFPQTDPNEIQSIVNFHKTFATYLPQIKDIRKEIYFVAQRTMEWEQHRKTVLQTIQTRKNIYLWKAPTDPTRPAAEKQYNDLQNVTLPLVNAELEGLYALSASYENIKARRLVIDKACASAAQVKNARTPALQSAAVLVAKMQARLTVLQADLLRYKSAQDFDSLHRYFTSESVSDLLRQQFPEIEQLSINTINQVHRDLLGVLPFTKTEKPILDFIDRLLQSLKASNSNRAIEKEINDLKNYWVARAARSAPEQLSQAVQQKNNENTTLLSQLVTANNSLNSIKAEVDQADAVLNTPMDVNLFVSAPLNVTRADIVRGKMLQYKTVLAQKDHKALLEDVVAEFRAHPDKYPVWLQYMVIHFSGMRYRSAHGSWADPRDLLINLNAADINDEFKNKDDAAIKSLCEARLAMYDPLSAPLAAANPGPTVNQPKLARTSDPAWKARLADNLHGLGSPLAHNRRKALIDLRLDEDEYELESLSGDQAGQLLRARKDEFPEWMWKEIVRLTPLRTQEVESTSWENSGPTPTNPKVGEVVDNRRWNEFRQVLIEWKKENITGWREESASSNELIVTSAVCNEVAEHIQHIRGNTPPGGLAPKPLWYLKNGTLIKASANAADYPVGASILWLNFENDEPGPWCRAGGIALKNGEELIPAALFQNSSAPRAGVGGWLYKQSGDFMATRTWVDKDPSIAPGGQQIVRWRHEATVAAVAETADGWVVITFETALPREDRRLATIGVFKHYLADLAYSVDANAFNAGFVGFMPEGNQHPLSLEGMLNWNKILLRPVASESELAAYRDKYIWKGQARPSEGLANKA